MDIHIEKGINLLSLPYLTRLRLVDLANIRHIIILTVSTNNDVVQLERDNEMANTDLHNQKAQISLCDYLC
jgi:hypothetical protein